MKKNDFFYRCTILLASVENASMGKAAGIFDISVSQVSRHIRGLEETLGFKLIEASSRGISPTLQGARFIEQIQPLLQRIKEAEHSIFQGVQSTVKLSLPASIGTACFGGWIARIQSQHPQMRLKLSLFTQESSASLSLDELRVILSEGPPQTRVIAKWLCRVPLVTVCAPNYPGNQGITRIGDLADHRLLICHEGGKSFASLLYFGSENMISSEKEPESLETYLLQKNLALSGYGIAVGIPEILVRKELESGELVQLLPGWRLPSPSLWLLRLPQRYTPLLVQQITSSLLEEWK